MKPNQLNKLYAKLTPHEQAALVFEAAARKDVKDIDAILDNVERKTYVTVHADYHRRAYALQWLVAQYGIDYWKNRALMHMACNHIDEGGQQMADYALTFLAKVVALETAIAETCKLLKVDVAAIKIIAGCLDDPPPSELPPVDAELVRQYTDVYSQVLK